MADEEVAKTSLELDAQGWKEGAGVVQDAGDKIIASNEAVIASEAKTATAIASAEDKKAAARKTGTAAATDAAKQQGAAAATGADAFAKATDRIATSTRDQDRFLQSLARKYDPFSVAVQGAQKEVARLQGIIEAGGPNAARAADFMTTAQKNLRTAQDALSASSGQGALAANILAGAHEHVTGSSVKARESLVLFHEMMSGNYKRAVGSGTILLQQFVSAATLLNPVTLGIAAIAAATIGWIAVTEHAAHTQAEMNAALIAGNNATGLTRTELQNLASAAARASGQTSTAMRGVEETYIRTGRIGGEVFKGLVMTTADYAALAGVEVPEAQKALAKAFADPAKGAQELSDATLHLSRGLIEHIQILEESGEHEKAQALLLEAVTGKAKGLANDGLTAIDRVWRSIKQTASDAIESMTHVDTAAEKVAKARRVMELRPAQSQPGLQKALDMMTSDAEGVENKQLQVAAVQRLRAENEALINSSTEIIHKNDELYARTRELTGEIEALAKGVSAGRVSEEAAAVAAQKLANAKGSLLTAADKEHAAATIEVAGLRLNRQEREQTMAVWSAQLALSGKTMSDADRIRAVLDAWTVAEQKRRTAIADTTEDLKLQAEADQRLAVAAAQGSGPLHQAEIANAAFALALKAGAENTPKFTEAYAKYIEQLQKDDIAKRAADLSKWVDEQTLSTAATLTLAEATLKGGAAVAEANIQNKLAAEIKRRHAELDAAAQDRIEIQIRAQAQANDLLKARNQLLTSRETLEAAELELRLATAAPEVRQRELDLLKIRQQLVRDNIALDSAEGQELLKNAGLAGQLKGQAEELKQQQQLWIEPFKNAAKGIQDAFANAFETIFSGGRNAFADLGHIILQTMARVAAQIAALLVFRPIVGGLAGAIPGFSGIASSLSPGAGSPGGGFGLGDLSGGVSLGRNAFDFANGGFSSASNWLASSLPSVFAANTAGATAAGGAISGGLELGGAASIGAEGITAASGLAMAIPYIGAAIAVAAVLYSVLHKSHPKNVTADMAVRQQPWLQMLQGFSGNSLEDSFYFGDRGSSNGADTSVFDPLTKQFTGGLKQILGATGGAFKGFDTGMSNGDQSFVGRVGYNSTTGKYGYQVGEQQFSADNLDDAMSGLLVQSIKHAKIDNLSDSMKTVLKNTQATTVQDLLGDISFAKQYDRGFQATSQYDQALEQLNATYDAAVQRAQDLGLETKVVTDAQARDVATLKANTMADLQTRQLVAEGRNQEADDLRRQIAQQQELAAETDPAIRAEILRTQAIENTAIANQRAADAEAQQVAALNTLSGAWANAYAANQNALQAEQAVTDAINQAAIEGLNKQLQAQSAIASKAQQAAQAFGQIADSLEATRLGMLVGQGSSLSLGQQLGTAQSAFRDAFNYAMAHPDNADAFKDLSNLATVYRNANLAQFAGNAQGVANDQEILSDLAQARDIARGQQSIQQKLYDAAQTQIDLLQKQLDALDALKPSGPTDEQRKAAATARAVADFTSLAAQVTALHSTGNWKNVFTGQDDFTNSSDYQRLASQRDAIIGRISDPAALFGLLNQFYSADPRDPGALAIKARLHELGVQGFAAGGVTGRVAFVHPGEMLYTGPSARVFNPSETNRLMAGAANDRLGGSTEQGARIIDLLSRLVATQEAIGVETIRSQRGIADEARATTAAVRQAGVPR